MFTSSETAFDLEKFLSRGAAGRRIVSLEKGESFFVQGDPANCVLYLKTGRAKISVVSSDGKDATIRLVTAGDFFGEKAMANEPGVRVTNAIALTACSAIQISRPEFLRLMRENREFS
jgi:CRP/FNR family transcriptional regulator, cyclic AMP receptor protein